MAADAPADRPSLAAEAAFVRRSLALLLAGIAVLALVTGAAVLLATRTDDLTEFVEEAQATRNRGADVRATILEAEASQRGYILSGDDAYLGPYEEARAWLGGEMARLRALPEGSGGPRLAERLRLRLAELEDTLALVREGRREEALAAIRSGRGKESMGAIRTALGNWFAAQDRQRIAAQEALGSNARRLVWTTVAGALAILLFAVLAAWLVTRYVRVLRDAEREVGALNEGLEARVRERTTDLSRANDEIQRFAYIVSHDLRSPLVNVMGFTKELEAGLEQVGAALEPAASEAALREARTAAREDMPEAIRFIRTSTSKMDRLINAILRLSREGRRELRPERVDLAAALATVAATVRHQAEEAGARVEVPAKAPSLVTDRLALDQILGNLVDNAVKYLDPGRPGVVTVTAEARAGGVEVAVADNGRGIAPGDLERVFELFRRSGKQDRPGEGIGLAHVRALARRLGGDVTVESVLGQGSRFRLSLPSTPPPATTGPATA